MQVGLLTLHTSDSAP